jgi:hypothetical protein
MITPHPHRGASHVAVEDHDRGADRLAWVVLGEVSTKSRAARPREAMRLST